MVQVDSPKPGLHLLQRQVGELAKLESTKTILADAGHFSVPSKYVKFFENVKGMVGLGNRTHPAVVEFELMRILAKGAFLGAFSQIHLDSIQMAARKVGLTGDQASHKTHAELLGLMDKVMAQANRRERAFDKDSYRSLVQRFFDRNAVFLKRIFPNSEVVLDQIFTKIPPSAPAKGFGGFKKFAMVVTVSLIAIPLLRNFWSPTLVQPASPPVSERGLFSKALVLKDFGQHISFLSQKRVQPIHEEGLTVMQMPPVFNSTPTLPTSLNGKFAVPIPTSVIAPNDNYTGQFLGVNTDPPLATNPKVNLTQTAASSICPGPLTRENFKIATIPLTQSPSDPG